MSEIHKATKDLLSVNKHIVRCLELLEGYDEYSGIPQELIADIGKLRKILESFRAYLTKLNQIDWFKKLDEEFNSVKLDEVETNADKK